MESPCTSWLVAESLPLFSDSFALLGDEISSIQRCGVDDDNFECLRGFIDGQTNCNRLW